MFCVNCGKQNPDGAKFCYNCGTRINTVPAYQTPPAKQAEAAPKASPKPAPAKKKTGFGKGIIISLVVYIVFYACSYVAASWENDASKSDTYSATSKDDSDISFDYNVAAVPPVEEKTGYTSYLDGWWEQVSLKDGNFSLNVSALCFSETVYNCTGLTVNMDVTMNAGTSCKDWQVWGRSGGTFVKLAKVYLPDGDGYVSQNITFQSPVTFDAIAVTPTIVGGYSWSMSLSITDVWAD